MFGFQTFTAREKLLLKTDLFAHFWLNIIEEKGKRFATQLGNLKVEKVTV